MSSQSDPSVRNLLLSGGDERTRLDPVSGRNRYHIDPTDHFGLLHRGSCTCGVLNDHSLQIARSALEAADQRPYASWVAQQANRLRALANVEHSDEIDVYFAPSGTDLSYYPLLFQHLLDPGRRILNILSCPEELGSGSMLACVGRFFGQQTQFGEATTPGDALDEMLNAAIVPLDARTSDGHIIDRRSSIEEICKKEGSSALVGSLVVGSKSGIVDDLAVIDEFLDSVMWTVDLCQFRVDTHLIGDLLSKGVMVMITGSKFFEAPPFAAALLVPRRWTDRLAGLPVTEVAGFAKLFSAFDLPPQLTQLRAAFTEQENLGLRVRWEIALDEMEAFAAIPATLSDAVIAEWNQVVTGALRSSEYCSLMPDQEQTNPSIISFQVERDGRELDHEQLRKLHYSIATRHHEGLSSGLTRVFLGQPVRYGDRSFLRIAIGSPSVRKAIRDDDHVFLDDLRLISIIEENCAN